jgi:hypothetical protein
VLAWREDGYENEEWYKNWWKYHELPQLAMLFVAAARISVLT